MEFRYPKRRPLILTFFSLRRREFEFKRQSLFWHCVHTAPFAARTGLLSLSRPVATFWTHFGHFGRSCFIKTSITADPWLIWQALPTLQPVEERDRYLYLRALYITRRNRG
jgi:hypothetical protein